MTVSPDCMDAEELALWQSGNGWRVGVRGARARVAGRASTLCEDCTLGYAADMRAIGRCNGTPGGVEEDEDMTDTIAALGTAVEIVAPCERCVHAAVCRLRPPATLAGSAELPTLAAELEVTLTATVECAEYARAPKGRAQPAETPRREISPEGRERMRQAAIATAAKRRAGKEGAS